jgi:hypothetical protein
VLLGKTDVNGKGFVRRLGRGAVVHEILRCSALPGLAPDRRANNVPPLPQVRSAAPPAARRIAPVPR